MLFRQFMYVQNQWRNNFHLFKAHTSNKRPLIKLELNMSKRYLYKLSQYLLILVGHSSCNTSGSDDNVTMMMGWQGQNVCGGNTWENIECQKVIEIPFDVDGMKVYSIKESNYTDFLRRCRDGRPLKKRFMKKMEWIQGLQQIIALPKLKLPVNFKA